MWSQCNSSSYLLDYVKRFATEEALRETEKNEQSSDEESSMSDFSEDEAKDMEL
jgi:ubiquitin-conjugating enzyme E2 H